MNQKTKLITLIAIVAVVIIIGAMIVSKSQPRPLTPAPQTQNQQATTPTTQPVANNQVTPQVPPQIIDGDFVSYNEKQIYVKLADGKGAAININAATPVRTEADNKIGNLSLIKKGQKLSITVNENTDAIEITIKK